MDRGSSIHTGTLIVAARRGDVGCVRFLHSRGVPLWDHASDEGAEENDIKARECICMACKMLRFARKKIIGLPCKPEDASHMLPALLYGWIMGAPLSQTMQEVFKARRQSTRAVLLCFHVAARLSQGWGVVAQRAAWSAMQRMPMELIEEILILAELEIPESLGQGLSNTSKV
jgi:hypothetical protein